MLRAVSEHFSGRSPNPPRPPPLPPPRQQKNQIKDCIICELNLRAIVSNFRESGDRSENSNFFLFAPKDPFGELFSKIIF